MGCQRKHPPHISLASMLLSRRILCPVLARSSYNNLIDPQLPGAVRLISGCLQPTQLSWLPVLSNVAPPSQCHKAATDNMLQIIEAHPNRPVCADVFEHSPPRLASRRPISSDMMSVDTITQWRDDWSSTSVVNHTIVTGPTILKHVLIPPKSFEIQRTSLALKGSEHLGVTANCTPSIKNPHNSGTP